MTGSVYLRLQCLCGARVEGWFTAPRLRAAVRAFSKPAHHHHPSSRDSRGRFVAWAA